jgi:hypothetical protein
MANSFCPWLTVALVLLAIPAAQAQTPNSMQFYIDHPAERRAMELHCYQQGATGTKADATCENAERASWAALANDASQRALRPEQNPASPTYWHLRGPYAARMELQDCVVAKSNPMPPPPAVCEAAALSVLSASR